MITSVALLPHDFALELTGEWYSGDEFVPHLWQVSGKGETLVNSTGVGCFGFKFP